MTQTERTVLAGIAQEAGDVLNALVGRDDLSKRTGIAEADLDRFFETLEESGHLRIETFENSVTLTDLGWAVARRELQRIGKSR